MAPSSRKISSGGEVVDEDSSSTPSSTSLLSGGRRIDVFGFSLDVRQFLLTLSLAYLMLGPQGTLALLIAVGAYTLFVRMTTSSAGGSDSRGAGRWSGGRRGGGGGGGGGRGGRGGANIKGVKDLPCDPKGG